MLRIIPRGGSKKYLPLGRVVVLDLGVLLLPGSVYDEPRHIRFGYGRKSIPESLSQFGAYLDRHFLWNVLAVDGPEKKWDR